MGFGGVWDSRPPMESPSACSSTPDISSIFELRFKSRDLGNYVYEWDLVMDDSKNCIFEDTYLAWNNGEPIAEESRQETTSGARRSATQTLNAEDGPSTRVTDGALSRGPIRLKNRRIRTTYLGRKIVNYKAK